MDETINRDASALVHKIPQSYINRVTAAYLLYLELLDDLFSTQHAEPDLSCSCIRNSEPPMVCFSSPRSTNEQKVSDER